LQATEAYGNHNDNAIGIIMFHHLILWLPKHNRIITSNTVQTPYKMYGASKATTGLYHYAHCYEKDFAAGNGLYQTNFDGLEKPTYKFQYVQVIVLFGFIMK
jgi:hypothetical protein